MQGKEGKQGCWKGGKRIGKLCVVKMRFVLEAVLDFIAKIGDRRTRFIADAPKMRCTPFFVCYDRKGKKSINTYLKRACKVILSTESCHLY